MAGFSRRVFSDPSAIAALAAGLLALVALVAFTPRYETNDDVVMNLIAAGRTFVDRPDEHLLFTNVLIGWPMSRLYAAMSGVPWYGLLQVASILTAAMGTTYAILRVNPSRWQLVVVLLLVGIVFLPCLTQIQYTKTAFLVSLAGLLLILAPVRCAAPWPRFADVAAVVLVVLGSLIRFESFVMSVIVAAPVVVVAAGANLRGALRRWIPVTCAMLLVVGGFFFNRAYYARDPRWKDFYAYYTARSQFTDYQRVRYQPGNESAFEAVGWSRTDFDMLMTWFFADRERYSLANLRQVLATAPPAERPTLRASAAAVVQSLVEAPPLQQLALATLCVAILAGTGWRRLILPALLFAWAFGVAVGLSTYYWAPPRVLVSLFSGVAVCAAMTSGGAPLIGAQSASRAGMAVRALGVVLAVGLILRTTYGLVGEDTYRAHLHQESVQMLRRLKPRPEQLFVVWREQLPFEDLVQPLKDPAVLEPLQCLSLSGLLDTPFTEERLAKFNIDDIYRALWERPTVLLATDPRLVDYLRQYAREHYRVELEFPMAFYNPQPFVYIVHGQPVHVRNSGRR
jgi:hypothetical protein